MYVRAFFIKHAATPQIYTLSLLDALPIWYGSPPPRRRRRRWRSAAPGRSGTEGRSPGPRAGRSEEHTSELQSLTNLVCRLLLEIKKRKKHKTRQYESNNRALSTDASTKRT